MNDVRFGLGQLKKVLADSHLLRVGQANLMPATVGECTYA
jgi:hypothetical protein